MLAYPILQFLVFWLFVNFDSITLTFKRFSWDTGTYVYKGFVNYKNVIDNILHQQSTQQILIVSGSYFIVSCFVTLPLSLLLAYFLYKKIPCASFFRVVYFLPSILPVVVLTMTYQFMFDPNLGPINDILKAIFHLQPAQIPSWFGEYPTMQIIILLYCVWAGLGYNILLLSGSINRIPSEIIEYGKLEGLNMWQEFTKVIIPLTWPTISTTFILGCTSVFTVMMQPLLLTPNSPQTVTIALSIYNAVLQNRDLAYFTTFGLLLSIIGMPIILLIKKGLSKIYEDVEF